MIPQAAAGAAPFPCRLLPPCKQGNHGFHIKPNGERAIKTLGKYYFTEDALEHDLSALKRGDVYDRDEFFKRAKAWYKAEIDRLLHLGRVRKETPRANSESHLLPTAEAAEPSPAPETPTTPLENTTPIQSRATPVRSQTPTRIQPARAAKRRAAAPPPPKRPPRRIKTAPAPNPAPIQRRGPQIDYPNMTSAGDETRGDYALAVYDWAQFLNGNEGEHHPSPWSYVQLQGLDVAYFCMRLERAVGEKICKVLLARDGPGAQGVLAEDPERSPEEQHQAQNGRAEEKKEDEPETSHPQTRFSLQAHPNRNPRCALSNSNPAAPFEPAAALAPGEDWRPPATPTPPTPTANLNLAGTTVTATGSNSKKHRVIDNTANRETTPTPTTSWAADEVNRREELNRKTATAGQQQQQQAPQADMEISPTLGRWRRRSSGLGTNVNVGSVWGGMEEEDLGANVVEVSGLRFAVDLCMCTAAGVGGGKGLGGGEGVRVLML